MYKSSVVTCEWSIKTFFRGKKPSYSGTFLKAQHKKQTLFWGLCYPCYKSGLTIKYYIFGFISDPLVMMVTLNLLAVDIFKTLSSAVKDHFLGTTNQVVPTAQDALVTRISKVKVIMSMASLVVFTSASIPERQMKCSDTLMTCFVVLMSCSEGWV